MMELIRAQEDLYRCEELSYGAYRAYCLYFTGEGMRSGAGNPAREGLSVYRAEQSIRRKGFPSGEPKLQKKAKTQNPKTGNREA